jgi:hypothetical protein
MRNFFSLISIVLLSAVAASAQTAGDLKPQSERGQEAGYAAHLRVSKPAEREGKSVTGARAKARLNKDAKLRAPQVLRVGPSTTYLKNGLSADEVVRFLGQPGSVSEEQEGDARLTTYIFPRGEGRIIVAEFKDGALVGSRTELAPDKEAR